MSLAALIAAIVGALVSLFTFLPEFENNNYKKIARGVGIILIIVGLFFVIYDTNQKQEGSKLDKKEGFDSLKATERNIQSVTQGDGAKTRSYDSTGKEKMTTHLDSSIERNGVVSRPITLKPVIDISALTGDGDRNPSIRKTTSPDSIRFDIALENVGNDIAYNIVDRLVVLNYDANGKLHFYDIGKGHVVNKKIIIAPNDKRSQLWYILTYRPDPNKFFAAKVFVYIKCTYKNSEKNPMDPFQRIYLITATAANEVSSEDYEMVEKDLRKFKLY
jgi:uncharacterized protein YxeA